MTPLSDESGDGTSGDRSDRIATSDGPQLGGCRLVVCKVGHAGAKHLGAVLVTMDELKTALGASTSSRTCISNESRGSQIGGRELFTDTRVLNYREWSTCSTTRVV